MKLAKKWIITADERQASLYSCQEIEHGRWRIQPQRELQNSWEDYHEHHRPNALGRGPSANAAQHFASFGHESEEEHKRFAREVVQWLTKSTQELSIDRVDIFAASRFLGVLRKEIDQTKVQAELHQAELTRLAPADLAIHPAVLSVLQPQVASR